jgi:hypothetical protein
MEQKMKVKDLIEALQTYDQELMVIRSGYEGGVEEINTVELEVIALNVNEAWYYGSHETIDDLESNEYLGHERIKAVYIS